MYKLLNVTNDSTHCGHLGHVITDFGHMCRLAAEHGFDAVNIDLVGGSQSGIGDMIAILQDHGLRAAAFGLPVPVYSQFDEAMFEAGIGVFEQHARWASRLGCRIVTAYLPPYSDIGFNDNFTILSRRLSMLRPVLEDYGLRIAFEFIGPSETRANAAHDFIHTIDGVRCLIAAADLYGLAGFKLDIHHWQFSGATLLDLRHLDPQYLLYVELNDALPGYDMLSMPEFTRELPLDTGVTNVAGFMQVLGEKRYDGPVAVEPWNAVIREMTEDQAIRAVKGALDKCFALAG